jgi:hypothetical protein
MTIEFVDTVPPKVVAREIYTDPVVVDFVKALRANPGRWAKHPVTAPTAQQARSLAYRIKQQCKTRGTPLIFMPDSRGSFQATSRVGTVYVRYVKRAAGQRK